MTIVPLLLAITALGLALLERDGTRSLPALALLALTLTESWIAVWAGDTAPDGDARRAGPLALAVQCAGLMFVSALVDLPRGSYLLHAGATIAMAASAVFLVTAEQPRSRRWRFMLLMAVTALVGLNLLKSLPRPGIDVLMFQREALDRLLAGMNPYTMEFRDPYPPEWSAVFYGPGVSVDGILKFGYPYMPLTLVSALPGHLLGDVRYASLCAMLLSAALIAHARESRTSYLAAALLLTTPAFPTMLLKGWVEAHVVALVAATWWVYCRAPRLLPYAAGLLFAAKQYTIIIVPALLMLARHPALPYGTVPFLARAVVTGAAITLPLALWDISAFLHSVAWLQFRQPFRWDALSFLTLLKTTTPERWVALSFAMTAAAWLVIARAGRRVSFPLAIALAFLAFFAFNKQAFLNYYYLVLGCLCVALAATEPERADHLAA
jgi:hypothetical protein